MEEQTTEATTEEEVAEIYKKDYWDIDFVMKAYKYLRPNGELLAITSADLSHGKKPYKRWIKKLEDEQLKQQELWQS